MARETENLKLSLYDPTEDKDVKVKDVINNVLGYANSNTTKIDAAFKGVDDNIQILHDYILDSDGNVIYYSKTEVDALLTQHTKDTLLAAYPVGSLYMSTEATSPASLFGGAWEQIKDRFILAAGDTYAAGSTGGEAKHTLTENELPYIDGSWQTFVVNGHMIDGVSGHAYGGSASKSIKVNGVSSYESDVYVANAEYIYGFKFGQNVPHNNMPPYLTAYIWRRIT